MKLGKLFKAVVRTATLPISVTADVMTFISGKRGLDRKLELIRFEGLTDILVEEIII